MVFSLIEMNVWYFFYNVVSVNLLVIYWGNCIFIYFVVEFLGMFEEFIFNMVLWVMLQNFMYNVLGWFDNYFGISIINFDGVQYEVLWSSMFIVSNIVVFNLLFSMLQFIFFGDYSIQFWIIFDWVVIFGCNDYFYWLGYYIVFDMDIFNYMLFLLLENDQCVDVSLIVFDVGNICIIYYFGIFFYVIESEIQVLFDNCQEGEDVWFQFVVNSMQYELNMVLVSGEGIYFV